MKPLVVTSEDNKLGLELGSLGVVTALTQRAGASKDTKAATRAAHRKAGSPCICRKADGSVTVIARTKRESRTIKSALPTADVRYTKTGQIREAVAPLTYEQRMAKYHVPTREA